ncbi:MAG: histidine kinase [Bauldia sp.]
MPSLVRFLVVVVILAALVAAATVYLAFFVHPGSREMTIRIPDAKFERPK